jgi:hypothetical protein
MKTRKDFESNLGKPIYTFTIYQKVKRVTVPLESEEYPILMASFDLEADHDNIITNKILPLVNELGLYISPYILAISVLLAYCIHFRYYSSYEITYLSWLPYKTLRK